MDIEPGTVWVRSGDQFNFLYRYPLDRLSNYIYFAAGSVPQGVFIDFVEDRKEAFQRVFNVMNIEPSVSIPANASLDRFAVVKPKTHIGTMSWWPSATRTFPLIRSNPTRRAIRKVYTRPSSSAPEPASHNKTKVRPMTVLTGLF